MLSVDGPCIILQLDRLGFVKRVIATDLIVQRQKKMLCGTHVSLIMRLPKADSAIVDDAKVRDYLLSRAEWHALAPYHRLGHTFKG
jgi:hypothetical protein